MKGLVQIDHELTNRIRTVGAPSYGFWKFVASQGLYGFVLTALGFVVAEQLEAWYFALVFTTAYIVANLLQRLIKRNRPDFEKLTGYKMWLHSYSYPSAHSTMSAAAAAALALMTSFSSPETQALTIAGVAILALMIGLSRIVVGVHYFADVIFGWILGFVIAWIYWLFLLT
jgi:membrane-associated phospholipid phosphatase